MCANLYLGGNKDLSESLSFVSPIIASDEVSFIFILLFGIMFLGFGAVSPY
jgi:hypothetical protein